MPHSLLRFVRETRAGATAISAAAVTLMALGATAFMVDHVWLVHQRDLLKSASDAAVIAVTLQLQDLPGPMSDEDAETELHPVAERYVRLNLAPNLSDGARERMTGTLAVSVDIERVRGAVDVTAQADLGGTLLSRWLLDRAGPADLRAGSGAEGSLGATEIALVIDVTGSMASTLDGVRVGGRDPTSRMNIVKRAALDLVDILASHENSTIAVGLVPWTYHARLGGGARTRWETEGWAVYPTERTYPHPTRGPPGSEMYLPELQALPVRGRLPPRCRAWAGCADMRMAGGAPSFSTALPSEEPFTMGYFTTHTSYPDSQYVSYQCQAYTRPESRDRGGEEPLCYDLDRAPAGQNLCGDGDIQPDGPWRVHPQDNCGLPAIMPLNVDLEEVRNAIRNLRSGGSATYSSAGIAWGIRLLTSTWRETWNHAEHPMDPDSGVQKALVLLTDGEDNHRVGALRHRRAGCAAAKDQGIIVFTIAAMHPDEVGATLADELTKCSSQPDDPDGTYVFVNNSTPDRLRQAFANIVTQMIRLRRTY